MAHLAVLAALVVVLSLTFVAYMETQWMKAEIRKEARELRKLKEEFKMERKADDKK